MIKDVLKKIEQKGSLMIEAMAMLGLISMVTPIVYKKAAERTTELQDINEAGHIRILSRALDDYLRDNYNDISGNGQEKLTAAQVNELKAYFPRGFNLSSKLFTDVDFWVNKRTDNEGTPDEHKILTGFLVAKPVEAGGIPLMRASRLASMIGTNGGYTDGTANVQGVQGIWSVPTATIGTPAKGSIVATSIQTIATSAGGEDLLYRVDKGRKVLNTMETTLHMGSNSIDEVNKLIVSGNASDSISTAGGIKASGSLTAASASLSGALTAANATLTGALKAASANITGNTTTGTLNAGTSVLGNTTTGTLGAGASTLASAKVTTTLNVGGQSTLAGLTAGATTLASLNVTGATAVGGNLTVVGTTTLTGLLTANGGIKTPTLNAETLRGGTTAGGSDYNFTATNSEVTIKRGYLKSSAIEASLGDRVIVNDTSGVVTKGSVSVRDTANSEFLKFDNAKKITSTAATVDLNGMFKVNPTDHAQLYGVLRVYDTANSPVLRIENATGDANSTEANIYMRKGAIEIASTSGASTNSTASTKYDGKFGYINVDRLVGNTAYSSQIGGTTRNFDRYQVNPAYTSVMHDIKLSTRGGARLSDILPDFVNKGIYVLDNTYSYCNVANATDCSGKTAWNWEGITVGAGGVTNEPKACSSGTFLCEASPWMGFLPAPSCPPGYSKVATISPIRWAMSKAYSIDDTDVGNNPTIYQQYARSGANVPYKFQTSTWLNTALKKYENGGAFFGWSGIMGFIYPGWDYATEIKRANPSASINDNTIVWNLFPVYNQELAAIANVYCYFDRSQFQNSSLVDSTYNQLTKIRTGYDKPDADYNARLNDTALGYTEVW